MVGKEFMTAVFEPQAKDRVRVLIVYKDQVKSICWLEVGKDGSIYISPRKKEIKNVKKGTSQVINGAITVSYDEGEIIEDTSNLRTKTSFHASGIVNSIDSSRSVRKSLRDINKQEELCFFVFQHPNKFESLISAKKRDVLVQFPISDEVPLLAYVFVSPLSKTEIVEIPFSKNQYNIILEYKNLENCQDLSIQLVFITLDRGNEWPPYTYMVYPTGIKN